MATSRTHHPAGWAARDAAAKVQILDPGLHGLGAAHAGTHVRRLVHRDQPMARFQERMGEPPDARAELENARLLR